MGSAAVSLTAGLCAAAAAAAAAAAQQSAPFWVRVGDVDGKAVANATVTVAAVPDGLARGAAEVVQLTTDAHGRASCELPVGRVHVAWAIGAPDAEDACLVTRCEPFAAAGRSCDLAVLARVFPRRLRVPGLSAWRAAGVVGMRWYPVAAVDARVELQVPDGEDVILPVEPFGSSCLELSGQGGEPLAMFLVPEGVDRVALPEPLTVPVTAVDDLGAPVAGAGVWAWQGCGLDERRFFDPLGTDQGHWLRLANTDSRGHGTCLWPRPASLRPGPADWRGVVVTGANHQPTFVGIADDSPVRVVLPRTQPSRIRFVGRDVASAATRIPPPMNGWLPIEVARTGDSVSAMANAAGLRVYPGRAGDAVPDLTAFLQREAPEGWDHDFGKHRRVQVQVVDADGLPVPAVLGLATVRDDLPFGWLGVTASDRRGRVSCSVADGAFFVYATTGRMHGVALLQPEGDAVRLVVEPLPTIRVRVTDAADRPVAGARVQGWNLELNYRARNPGERQLLRVAWMQGRACAALPRSDARGELTVPLFARWSVRDAAVLARGVSSAPFSLVAGEVADVVIR